MTDEQINIAIAESLGWHSKSGANGGVKWVDKDGIGRNGGGLYGHGYNNELKLSHLPNYTADLNACHEFEKMLDDKQLARYAQQIIGSARREMNIPDHESHYPVPFIISATARQRCEAYLKTIGKWKEAK